MVLSAAGVAATATRNLGAAINYVLTHRCSAVAADAAAVMQQLHQMHAVLCSGTAVVAVCTLLAQGDRRKVEERGRRGGDD